MTGEAWAQAWYYIPPGAGPCMERYAPPLPDSVSHVKGSSMAAKQSQEVRVYRMLLKGATTDDFCNGTPGGIAEGLANNWRARKTKIGKLLKPMGGRFEKKREKTPTGRTIFRYKIVMPPESDQQDPLGWIEREQNDSESSNSCDGCIHIPVGSFDSSSRPCARCVRNINAGVDGAPATECYEAAIPARVVGPDHRD